MPHSSTTILPTADLPRPRIILFDWDLTLVDSSPAIHAAMNATLIAMEQRPWSDEEAARRIRRSLRESFPALFGTRWKEARAIFYQSFRTHHLQKLRPLSGAAEALAALADFTCGIVSNKTGTLLRAEIAHLGWQTHFVTMIGAGDAERDKPDPAPIHLALQQCGLSHAHPDQVWYVGDTDLDMLTAQNANCRPVFVGDTPATEGEAGSDVPRHVIRDVSALADLLRRIPV